MRTTQALSITLPHKMAALVRKKVKSGEYASESEVVREGLRALKERDDALEHWLRTEVVKSIRQYEADPSTAVPGHKVMAVLRAKSKERQKVRLKT